ncbi:MAG: MBL fold metallo-hydrolase [bacterium]|nr:MBL fold metallo-hydrolase [bacterium]
MSHKATIGFFGGVDAVTGSNFLFEAGGKRILIDCGLFQGERFADERNREDFGFDPKSIDVLLVTHAHIDHIGRIPKLVRDGFRGVIYSTPPTHELAEIMLLDTVRILAHEATANGVSPLYEEREVRDTLQLWKSAEYHVPFSLAPDLTCEFRDAGHMLGSAMMFLKFHGTTLVMTGDLGNSPTPLLCDTEPVTGTTYLLMESVYGNRNHEGIEERKGTLRRLIEDTTKGNGTLIIPVFTIERAQELLFEMNDLIERHHLHPIPVFVDSPLAIKATEIYRRNTKYFNTTAKGFVAHGDDVFRFPRLTYTESKEDSRGIWETKGPKVIMGGAGMLNGGRIVHHVKHYANDPKATILFVGYQAAGTAGRRLIEGERTVRLFGEETHVSAKIEVLNGYSGHKDMDHLLDFVETGSATLKKVFVAIGEPKAAMFLAQRIRDYLGLDAVVPQAGTTVGLEF